MLCAVHTSGNGARPSGQQYSLFSCCNTLSADCSTFRLTITRHKSRTSSLCSCDNNSMLGNSMLGNCNRKLWLQTLLFFPNFFSSSSSFPQEEEEERASRTRPGNFGWLMRQPSLVCNATPELSCSWSQSSVTGVVICCEAKSVTTTSPTSSYTWQFGSCVTDKGRLPH